MSALDSFHKFLRRNGRALEEIGSADVAVTRQHALDALNLIEGRPVIVLGVQRVVYDDDNSPAYDPYGIHSLNDDEFETLEQLSKRSKDAAKHFILEMCPLDSDAIRYVLNVCDFSRFNELGEIKKRADQELADWVTARRVSRQE